ncbi:MAG: hypothetical protein AAGF88_08055 [Pseudomonadota bacterium]
MAESEFRFRNLKVVIDITMPAELDAEELKLTEDELNHAAKILKKTPFSGHARIFGDVHVREISGNDYIYVVGRDGAVIAVTLGGIVRHSAKGEIDKLMEKLAIIGIFRSSTGI